MISPLITNHPVDNGIFQVFEMLVTNRELKGSFHDCDKIAHVLIVLLLLESPTKKHRSKMDKPKSP